jgi:hypothetical protein
MSRSDYLADLHYNGVHVLCSRPTGRGRWVANGQHGRGDLTHKNCHLHGRVERIHGHDFEGPLVCGCDEGD